MPHHATLAPQHLRSAPDHSLAAWMGFGVKAPWTRETARGRQIGGRVNEHSFSEPST
jgi:hypothetical protein